MENSKIAALVELGILCRGEPVETVGEGESDPGPYSHSDHAQLCRFELPKHQHPFEDRTISTYSLYEPALSISEALRQTRLVVMLGAADSEALRACLASPNTVVVLFEPDDAVLARFLDGVRLAGLNRKNFFIFTGEIRSFRPALQDLLPESMFRVGTPAFFMTERIRRDYGEWAHSVIEYFEILHYRYAIYSIAGQTLCRSQPVRKIYRGLLYDQQLHAYANIGAFHKYPSIEGLRGVLRGETAVLVAAGPELSSKFDYLRQVGDRAVIICVNNALKPLVDAGIRPHFVIINDNSVESGYVFEHIPDLPGTIMVGHCLSDLGGDRFRQKYLFGSFLPELFEEREMLPLHGSVISAAFSLARHLGCAKAVFIGAQLASHNPWGLSYAKGTVGKDAREAVKPFINRYPQLYPVDTPFGGRLYTTINFLDAALWLTETVRLSGVECVNATRDSILYGPGISHDPEPALEERSVAKAFAGLFRTMPPKVNRAGVVKYLKHEIGMWTSILDVAKAMLAAPGPERVAKGMAILGQLDQSNVTYMVERHRPPGDPFDSVRFYDLVFKGNAEERAEGLAFYFDHVRQIGEEFLALLKKAARSI